VVANFSHFTSQLLPPTVPKLKNLMVALRLLQKFSGMSDEDYETIKDNLG
jgi:hypothetical protein